MSQSKHKTRREKKAIFYIAFGMIFEPIQSFSAVTASAKLFQGAFGAA
jgi:hypothetical protein